MLACTCINIVIEHGDAVEKVSSDSLGLSGDDKNCDFFSQDFVRIKSLRDVKKVHSELIEEQKYGSWIITRCLNCDLKTHAVNKDKGFVLAVSKLLNADAINNVKSSEFYSKVFQIVVNPNDLDVDDDILKTYQTDELQTKLKHFRQIVSDFVEKETADVMDRIKKFTEQQYGALNSIKERTFKEEESLIRVLQNSEAGPSSTNKRDSVSIKTIADAGKNNLLSPGSPLSEKHSPKRQKSSNLTKNRTNDELMFEFEGVSDDFVAFSDTEMDESEKDDEEEEEETVVDTEEEEGITINRKPRGSISSLAKSLPVNIPIFAAQSRNKNQASVDDELPTERKVDIAASIKALARSVHGDTAVFGELPRPRFSTQI